MIVAAMLAWYREDLDLLHDCIMSLKGICDRIVAVDGGYELIPGATGSSGSDEHDAVIRSCDEAGLELDLVVPRAAWSGQVAKRDWMIKRATHGQQTPPDWLFVVDADYRVHADAKQFRAELASNPRVDVYQTFFYEPLPDDFDLANSPHEWHTRYAGKTIRHSLIFRAYPEPRLEKRHWYYSAVKNGVRVGMLGCPEYPKARTRPLRTPVTVEHRCFSRSLRTLERNRDYIIERTVYLEANGVEDGG